MMIEISPKQNISTVLKSDTSASKTNTVETSATIFNADFIHNLIVHHVDENFVSKLIELDYKGKKAIIDNLKPSDEEVESLKKRNKKLLELKRRLKEDELSEEEKEKLIDDFLKSTDIQDFLDEQLEEKKNIFV